MNHTGIPSPEDTIFRPESPEDFTSTSSTRSANFRQVGSSTQHGLMQATPPDSDSNCSQPLLDLDASGQTSSQLKNDPDPDNSISRSEQCLVPSTRDLRPVISSRFFAIAMNNFLPQDELRVRSQGLQPYSNHSFLSHLGSGVFHPQSPMLATATEAFALAQASSSLKDAQLSHASLQRYIAAVALLKSALSNAQENNRLELMASVLMLQIIETMAPTSQPQGWNSHVQGATQILEMLGPWKITTDHEIALFNQIRQGAILSGLHRRKRSSFSHEKWLVMSQSAFVYTKESRLHDLGSSIPGFLSATDELLAQLRDGPKLRSLFDILSRIRSELEKWIHSHISLTLQDCTPETFPMYFDCVGSSNILPSAFVFPSFSDAWHMTLAWIYLYETQAALLSIAHSNPWLASPDILTTWVHTTVSVICKTVPQFFNKDFAFVGRFGIAVSSRVRTTHLNSLGDPSKIRWCEVVEQALYNQNQGIANTWVIS